MDAKDRGLQLGEMEGPQGQGFGFYSWLPEGVMWMVGCTGQGPHLGTHPGKGQQQLKVAGPEGLAISLQGAGTEGAWPLHSSQLESGRVLHAEGPGAGGSAGEKPTTHILTCTC